MGTVEVADSLPHEAGQPFAVRSQKRRSEQLGCRCLKAARLFGTTIYGLTLGGNMMQ
jgi:hypothetical protein